MGLMNWLMKGVDQVEDEKCDEASIDDLKQISDIEKQESTTIDEIKKNINQPNYQNANMMNSSGSTVPNDYSQLSNQTINYQAYQSMAQSQFGNGGYNLGQSMNTTQNVFMQQAPNQPFAPVTITIFQISNEDDIKLALKHLGKKSPCAISFGKMSKRKFNDLYQFLSGGVFALGAKIVKWNENYILTPRGMEISKQDRTKK